MDLVDQVCDADDEAQTLMACNSASRTEWASEGWSLEPVEPDVLLWLPGTWLIEVAGLVVATVVTAGEVVAFAVLATLVVAAGGEEVAGTVLTTVAVDTVGVDVEAAAVVAVETVYVEVVEDGFAGVRAGVGVACGIRAAALGRSSSPIVIPVTGSLIGSDPCWSHDLS